MPGAAKGLLPTPPFLLSLTCHTLQPSSRSWFTGRAKSMCMVVPPASAAACVGWQWVQGGQGSRLWQSQCAWLCRLPSQLPVRDGGGGGARGGVEHVPGALRQTQIMHAVHGQLRWHCSERASQATKRMPLRLLRPLSEVICQCAAWDPGASRWRASRAEPSAMHGHGMAPRAQDRPEDTHKQLVRLELRVHGSRALWQWTQRSPLLLQHNLHCGVKQCAFTPLSTYHHKQA